MAQINILMSDETLLVQEASDAIVSSAKAKGVEETEIITVNKKYDWTELLANSSSLSLFASAKLTDIRFEDKPNKAAQDALIALLSDSGEDDWYILRFPKMDKKTKQTKWFKTISQNAQLQELWPPKTAVFPRWIQERARADGIEIEPSACTLLAEKTEGNLLAASQAIEKIKLLNRHTSKDKAIDKNMLLEVISDNAKFSVFLCIDAALEGRGQRAIKMLKKFKQEGQAPIVILGNLTREIQFCNRVSNAVSMGQPASNGFEGAYLWESKKRLIISAASRLPLGIWQKLIIRCAQIDKIVKGQAEGNVWLELEACLWILSGKNIWKTANEIRKAG